MGQTQVAAVDAEELPCSQEVGKFFVQEFRALKAGPMVSLGKGCDMLGLFL